MNAYEPFKPSDDHPNLLYYVWFEKLKFCGCGSPETVLRHLRGAMRALQDQTEAWSTERSAFSFGKWAPADQERSDGVRWALGGGEKDSENEYGAFYYMTAYLLAAADLTEHGGSVPGWLTDFGREVLARLEATDEAQWSVDLDGHFAEDQP